ncbi:family 78 glycoside hydrolase catalytic domain [uncultured Acetobacteroides sp.]|uniref:alpha-L-rhamnosidase n=1 Tax=uncultured Acetobacteroides sp. TaxID=1760811 RepID=UPI0029F56CA9|nr:family 78 glycoside hydrolase catalytic domain [uncultured Acetobacteroides sp.]
MKKVKLAAILIILILPILNAKAAAVRIIKLQTEYTQTPLGIEVEHPRFSWQMESDKPGCFQTAYQLIVFTDANREVWNSGKVFSGESLNIRYEGSSLQAATRYKWQLVVWDQEKKKHLAESWFETGLMDCHESAWNGAKWIGGNHLTFYSQYLPVFKINFGVQLDKKSNSTKAGFIYGANDERLMDKNKNIYKLENKRDSSYVLVELDLASLNSGGKARMNIYRAGYASKDKCDRPLKSFDISSSLINNQNRFEPHTVYLYSVLGQTEFYVDGETKENQIGTANLNPNGQGGDFVAYPVVANIGYALRENQKATFSNVQVRNFRAPSNVLFSDDFKEAGSTSSLGVFKTVDPSRNSMPMLRTSFTAKAEISKARLYVTSRGIYDMYINGKRISDDYFNPGSTQYNKTQLYQTFDVTSYLKQGKNGMGAILGEGWWSGGSTYMGQFWNFFGDRQSLLAKLVVTYADGTTDVIVSDPSVWKYFNNGPTVYSSMFQGEVYDATKEKLVEGWSTALYDDSAWVKCSEVPLEGTAYPNGALTQDSFGTSKLTGQYGAAVKDIKELTAQSVEEIRPGVFIYDMGQNMAGVPKITLKNTKPGQVIKLRFAEVKYPNLPGYQENTGMIMLENIRAAMVQDIYIAKGTEAVVEPRFTYHGFRYIEITGIDKPLPLSDVRARVLSSISELSSKFETSNPLVNKLWENITWSSYANFMSIPTDCPQRNERLGWSGDISVFSPTACYLATIPQFLRRHMLTMRDVQREDGRFPDVAPLGVGFGEMMWGSAGITVAWESFQQYNDKELLKEHYPAMCSYIEYLLRDINPQTGIFKEKEQNTWGSLGDWLSLEDRNNEKLLFWEAYLIYDLDIISKVAQILDRPEDAAKFKRLCDERKAFFNKTYLDRTSGKTIFKEKVIDTQASYALPLAFGIVDGDITEKVTANFANTITRVGKTDQNIETPPYSLMTGFIGTAWISKALSNYGRTDLAYHLLQQTTYPSWLYPIEQGATTIWERLNSYTHIDGFGGNNNMNSFNHYAFGAVGAWMYSYCLGIARDEKSPGFKHFVLKPEPDPTGKMSFAKGYYDSMYGRIESSWKIADTTIAYSFKVPSNTSATLILRAKSLKDITINNAPFEKVKQVRFVRNEGGTFTFEVQPGVYEVNVLK